MGSWNGTCAVSNLHIMAGQRVAVFMLLENMEKKTFCYSNAMYDVCPIPFYGEYNDYGAVENCNGFGLNVVVEALRSRLYEFGQGPNSFHDSIVNQTNFNIDVLFDADHEDRLGIQESHTWNGDAYDLYELQKINEKNELTSSQQFELDRLANKIKRVDTFRRVTHVIIHGDIFDDIMNKWYIEEYIGAGKGDKGYGNNYRHCYFRDIADSIPAYIAAKKADFEAQQNEPDASKWLRRARRKDGWDSPNLATKWLNSFDRGSSMEFGLIQVDKYIEEYVDAENWDGLTSFVAEALIGGWINSFMSFTRKTWAQTARGSQSSEAHGYRMLAQSVIRVLDAEKAEYDYEMGVDDE